MAPSMDRSRARFEPLESSLALAPLIDPNEHSCGTVRPHGARELAQAEPGIIQVNELLTMHFGPQDVLVALSLDFEDTQTAGAVEATVSRLERRIKAAHPDVTRVFIEAQSFEASRRMAIAAAPSETPPSH